MRKVDGEESGFDVDDETKRRFMHGREGITSWDDSDVICAISGILTNRSRMCCVQFQEY